LSFHTRRGVRSALIVLACIGFGAGCGSGTPAASSSTSPDDLGEAGPNRRLRFKPEFKQMIGKNGELLKKRPANIPKG
jgi:hypothetical protein